MQLSVLTHGPQLHVDVSQVRVRDAVPVVFAGQDNASVCGARGLHTQLAGTVVVQGPKTGAPPTHVIGRVCVAPVPVRGDGQVPVCVCVPGWQTQAARLVVDVVVPDGQTVVVVVVVAPPYPSPHDPAPLFTVLLDGVQVQTPVNGPTLTQAPLFVVPIRSQRYWRDRDTPAVNVTIVLTGDLSKLRTSPGHIVRVAAGQKMLEANVPQTGIPLSSKRCINCVGSAQAISPGGAQTTLP